MNTTHNRIKVSDLEKNDPDKILKTNAKGELEFSDASEGGSQDLQQTLENGSVAEGSSIELREGDLWTKLEASAISGGLDNMGYGTNKLLLARNNQQYAVYRFNEDKLGGEYIIATLDDIPPIVPVSSTVSGIVDNTLLQELGGVDKLINGVRIGRGNVNGSSSLAVGYNALSVSETGTVRNTAIGTNTLNVLTTGNDNTAVGAFATRYLTTGSYNTALGSYAGRDITTGNYNTALGSYAGRSITTGAYNTTVGSVAGLNLTTGNNNTVIGHNTGRNLTIGTNNTIVGALSGFSFTTASYNVGLGSYTLYKNQFGSANVAIGESALTNNVGVEGSSIYGYRSVAIGTSSMFNNTIGNGVAIGCYSLNKQTTGIWNIALGDQAGSGITTGSRNVIVASTGFVTSGGGITTGDDNMILSPNNGNTTGITTGNGNVIIGKTTGLSASDSGLVILANGTGTVAIRKNTNNELIAPNLTNDLITSGGNKSLLTKEYFDSKIGTVAPASSEATGNSGDIRVAGDYIYWYVAGTGWLRASGTTF